MTNFDNRNIRHQPASTDANRPNQTQLSNSMTERQSATNQTLYREGYEQGRYAENRDHEIRSRADENAANGILFGLLLASLVGLGAGAYYFLNQQNRTPDVVVPNVVVPKPSPTQPPEVRERVIERDRIVPVPQQAPQAPEVNITVPNSAPETQTTQPTQTAPQSTAPAPGNVQSGESARTDSGNVNR